MTSKTGNILVDILSNELINKDGKKRFIQAHLDKSIELINKKAYPEVFGDEIIDGLVIASNDSIRLIDNSLIDWFGDFPNNMTQGSRVGGKNPKFKQIKADMSTYGYKLRNIPIMVLDNGDGTYTPINGRTRNEILTSFGFVNCICIVYEAAPGKTPLEIKDAISKMGLKANAENDPAGDLMLQDVYNEGLHAIDEGFIKLSGNTAADYQLVLERVNEICGKGIFTVDKRTAVATRIVNAFATTGRVYSWSVKGAAEEWMKTKGKKFKNIEPVYDVTGKLIKRGIVYVVVSSATLEKSMVKAVTTACDNRDSNVRVIIHTGTLTGYIPSETYVKKIYNFRREWAALLNDFSFAFFRNMSYSSSPISLYGALPAVEQLGEMKYLKRFITYRYSLDDLIDNEYFDDGLEEV
tara:strand:- start:85 stop:1311 length:1227 start_codon:yes stop_codon:yes gene_type:complete